jgi:hypothetical protein
MEAAKRPANDTAPPASTVRSRLLYMDHDHATFVWDRLAVVMWRGECTEAAVRRVELAGMDVLRHFRHGALLGIVEPSAVPPPTDMREASAACNDRLAAQGVVGIAGVLTTTGFAGSVIRGVITGLTLLSKSGCPFKVYESHFTALSWLAEVLGKHGETLDVDEGARAIGDYRARYERYWNARFSTRPPPALAPR